MDLKDFRFTPHELGHSAQAYGYIQCSCPPELRPTILQATQAADQPYQLTGGSGNDSFVGGQGDDTIKTDAGDNTLNGGAGDDLLQGGADPDLYVLSEGNDTIMGFYANDQLTWSEEWAWSSDQAVDVYSTYEWIADFDFNYDYGYRLTFNVDGSTDEPEHSIEIYTNLLIEEDFWPLPNADKRQFTYLGNVRKSDEFKDNVGINFRGDTCRERIDFETLAEFAEDYSDDIESYRAEKGLEKPNDFASLESSLVMGVNAPGGDDTVIGGVNGDLLLGGNGSDFIDAGDGDDSLKAGAGFDPLLGGSGNDVFFAGRNTKVSDGADGRDRFELVSLATGLTRLAMGAGSDVVWNRGVMVVDDAIDLGAGDDLLETNLYLQAGALIGGPGDDVFVLRSDTAVVDGGNGNDEIEIRFDAAALGVKEVTLGDGSDRLTNAGVLVVDGVIDFGPGNDRFETTTLIQAKELDGGDGKNDVLILNAPNVEGLDDSFVDQLTGFDSSGFVVKNFETIRQEGGSWAFEGALEGVDLVIEAGTLQAILEAKNETAITMDQLNLGSGEFDFIINASNVVDDLRGRWRLVRTRKPIENLDQLVASAVLQINDEQQPLGLNVPMTLDCAPFTFELTKNDRGTALFLDVSLLAFGI